MIKSSVARSIGATIVTSSQQALQADGMTPLALAGETHLILSRADKQLGLDALVVDDLDVDVLAGTPFLIANDITVRPALCQVRIQDSDVINYNPDSDSTGSHAVRPAQSYVLRASSSTTVVCPGEYVEQDVPSDLGDDCVLALQPRTDTPISKHTKPTCIWPEPQVIEAEILENQKKGETMADVGKKRKSRAGHRTHAKKLIGQMKETLTGGEDIQEYTLKNWKTSLENKLVTLKQLDEAIVALMEGEKSVTVEDMALEIEESEGLSDETRKVVLMIEEVLATKQAIAAKANPQTSPDKPQQQYKTVRTKLPKLEVKRFGRGPCEWQEFWNYFESSVHNTEGLSDIDKFSYLRGMLHEPAKSAIAGFSLTTANYQSAVEVLKARFGKKTALQMAHMNELLGALPVYHERDTVKLRTLCDTIETHYRGLVALGVDESAYSSIVVPTLLEELPEAVRLTLTRGEAFREWTVKNLLDRLRQEVDLREEHKAQGTGRSRTGTKPEHSGGLRNTTGGALYTRAQREGCAFCQANHPHEDCRRELDIRKRRTLLRKFSRCFNCLRKGHKARECTDTSIKCKHCNGKHHTTMCVVGSQEYTPSPRGNNSADLVTSQALPKDSSMPVLMIGASRDKGTRGSH